jgi:hypothetical protein
MALSAEVVFGGLSLRAAATFEPSAATGRVAQVAPHMPAQLNLLARRQASEAGVEASL